MTSNSVWELAIRHVKSGQLTAFQAARKKFLSQWKQSPGVLADREFASFMALPKPDEREVFIGMTEWSDVKTYGAASGSFFGDKTSQKFQDAMAFVGSFDRKVMVMIRQIEGPQASLVTLAAGDGQVLEVAVRKPKAGVSLAAFHEARRAYAKALTSKKGVLVNFEFEVVSDNPEGLTVGMTAYSDKPTFQAAMAAVNAEPVAGAFFGVIEPVALQFCHGVRL